MVKAKKSKRKPKARPKTKAKPKAKATSKAKKPRARARRTATADSPALVAVTMTIDLTAAPGDVSSVRRINGQALATGKKDLPRGKHTSSWDVVSPSVRPIGYSVKITEDLSGNVLLDRPNQVTGNDGKGSGAGRFEV